MDGTSGFALGVDFRPEVFFVGRTEGAGVIRDSFGRLTRRCSIVTEGEWSDARQAIQFSEIFTYDDGEVDIWRWVMRPASGGRYVAAETLIGAGVTGRREGDDYALTFRRPVGPAKGALAPTFRTRFTLATPDVALMVVRLSLWGLPLGTMTAIHRRVAP